MSRLVKIIENVEIIRDVTWWTRSPDISLLNSGVCINNIITQKGIELFSAAVQRASGVGRLGTSRWGKALRQLPRLISSRSLEFIILPNIIKFCLMAFQLASGYGFPALLVAVYLYDCHSLAVRTTSEGELIS